MRAQGAGSLTGSFWPLAAAFAATQSTAIRHCFDCYDEAPSACCLSFRQMFSSPVSTDSSSPSPHPSCSSSSDGSSMMTSPLPSPASWHTTRQLSDVVLIDSPSHSRHSMAASSRADPLRTVGQHLAEPARCDWRFPAITSLDVDVNSWGPICCVYFTFIAFTSNCHNWDFSLTGAYRVSPFDQMVVSSS